MNESPPRTQYDIAAEYAGKARAYARGWAPFLNRLSQPVLEALPLAAAHRVLDVGAGSGGLLRDLQTAAPRATVVGVDLSLGMLQEARVTHTSPLVQMNALRLAFRPGSFDVAISTFIFQHIAEPAAALRELAAVLGPGGAIGLATWGDDKGMPAAEIWQEELDRASAAPDPRPPEAAHHELVDSCDKVLALVDQAGFVRARSWAQRTQQSWSLDELMTLQADCCAPSRRLRSLTVAQRAECGARVRRRVESMEPEARVYRPEVVYTIARRPA